jgi:hypothetical protein
MSCIRPHTCFTVLLAVLAGLPVPLAAQVADGAGKVLPERTAPVDTATAVTAPAPTGSRASGPAATRGTDTVSLGGAGSQVKGATSINAASGANNQQANAGIIASGDSALTAAIITQVIGESSGAGERNARVAVAAGAFAGSNGWLAINGAAGSGNQQVNLAIVAQGIEGLVMSDMMLEQTRASTIPAGEEGVANDGPGRSVAIGNGAFANSSGIIQLNLIGGDRNTTANSFALLVAGTAIHE